MVTLCQVTIIQNSILKPTSSSNILLLYKEYNKMDKISILKAKLTYGLSGSIDSIIKFIISKFTVG